MSNSTNTFHTAPLTVAVQKMTSRTHSSKSSSVYPGQETWQSIPTKTSDVTDTVASHSQWDYDHSVKSAKSIEEVDHRVNRIVEREAVSPKTFRLSVQRVEEWLGTCCSEPTLLFSPLKVRKSSISEISERILCTSSPFSAAVRTPKSFRKFEKDSDESEEDQRRSFLTPGKLSGLAKTPSVKRIARIPSFKRKKGREEEEGSISSQDEVEGPIIASKTPRKVLYNIGKTTQTPFKGVKTPGKKKPKTPVSLKRKCQVKSFTCGEPHNPVAIGDLLFQLNLMEEGLRTNPQSLGISSPHTARVLASQVAYKERALFGLLRSHVNRPSKLAKEVNRVKLEEATLACQRRKLFEAEDRKIDYLDHKILPIKAQNVSHHRKAQLLKSANQVAELERLSAARSVRKVFRQNQEVFSEVKEGLTTQIKEVREQLREERKKDDGVIDDLIMKLDWARERYHEDLDSLVHKFDAELDIKRVQKLDLRSELRKLRKQITTGIDADFRRKAECLRRDETRTFAI